ncbi:hypothetical protein QVE09_13455 [Paenibacillus sp. ClWae2A]|nr:hypothetical protein [Paenibacillus sp. ClWae2A]MDT9719916.1 hypothetical protein [Paenibacillus sp. ClWae2A]
MAHSVYLNLLKTEAGLNVSTADEYCILNMRERAYVRANDQDTENL